MEKNTKSEEMKLVKYIESPDVNPECFLDRFGEVYVRVQAENCFEIMNLNSQRFVDWVVKKYSDANNDAPKPSDVKKLISILRARAVYGDKNYDLSIRSAYNGGYLWYDLVDSKWRAIRIGIDGWEIIDNPPILFKRNIQKEQVVPERGGDVFELLNFINIKDDKQRILFLISTIVNFIPHIPRPIQVYFGTQGSAKSTTSRVLKNLIDPSGIELLNLLNDTKELTQQLHKHYLLSFDNLDMLKSETSDILCRAVTGGGLEKRKLYTDSDSVVFDFMRAVIINGINLVAVKPDLLDRSLLFELERVDEKNRKSEEDFWQGFNSAKPKILGAIFDVLSKALAILPTITLNEAPRMADFAKWGCAVAVALGYTQEQFIDAYKENCRLHNIQAIEESPVASAIVIFMSNCNKWSGTSQELLKKLKKIAIREDMDMKLFPKSPSVLSRRMNEVRKNLKDERIIMEKVGQREWNIENI